MIKFCWYVINRNCDVITFISKYRYFKKTWVSHLSSKLGTEKDAACYFVYVYRDTSFVVFSPYCSGTHTLFLKENFRKSFFFLKKKKRVYNVKLWSIYSSSLHILFFSLFGKPAIFYMCYQYSSFHWNLCEWQVLLYQTGFMLSDTSDILQKPIISTLFPLIKTQPSYIFYY